MALESVFGTPPPVVGAIAHNDTMIHGEKQRSERMGKVPEQEKEDGEIEEGEILDSGEEEGGNDMANDEATAHDGTSVNKKASALAQLMYKEFENGDDQLSGGDGSSMKKKKKKKKKKRKRSFSQQDGEDGAGSLNEDENVASKKQRPARYVDHDRVNSGEENMWFGRGTSVPQRRRESSDRFEQPVWPVEPPTQQSLRSQSRSPPGLYDSPRVSSDEFESRTDGGREGFGRFGTSSDISRPDFNKQSKLHKRSGKRRKRDKKGKGRSKQGKRKEVRRLMCKFYLDGKCTKGDDCTYSHDEPVLKKTELCKFYLNSFCAKSETCPFMHQEFPCKFFHMGAKCYSADRCKFSHDPLTDETKWILEKYLNKEDDDMSGNNDKFSDSSPTRRHRPSLLGSPPRHIKEMAAQEAIKKIPSLFDIEVEPPTTITPPTCGPIPHQNRSKFYKEPMNSHNHVSGQGPRMGLLPYPPSSFDPDCNDFPFDESMDSCPVPGTNMGSGVGPGLGVNSGSGPCFPMNIPGGDSRFGIPNSGKNMPFCDSRPLMMEAMRMDVDDRFPPVNEEIWDTDEELDVRRPQSAQPPPPPPLHPQQHCAMGTAANSSSSLANDVQQPFHLIPWRSLAVVDVDMRQRPHELDEDTMMPNIAHDDSFAMERDKSLSSESDGEAKKGTSGDGGSILIPLHLPKKQRELFLRIQQQQRQADSSQEDSDKGGSGGGEDKKPEDEELMEEGVSAVNKQVESKEEVVAEEEDEEEKAVKKAEMMENWYSSSEDDDDDGDQPLTAVLKKLQQEPLQKQAIQPSLQRPVFNITEMLKSITGLNSKPLTDSQSSIPASNKDFGRDPRAQRFTELRDPRSARVAVSELRDPRDPRSHQLRDPRLQAPPVAVESSSLRDPRLHGNSTDSNSSEDVKLPFTSKEVKSGIASCAGAGFSKSDTDTVAKTAYHPIPYRLRAVTISPPVYSTLALSSKTDPKLVQLDPRLKRQLTSNDPRARRISSRLAVGRVTKEMSDDIMQMDASVDEKLDRSGSRHSETFATIQSPPPLSFTSDTPFRIDEDKHRDEDSSKLKNSVEDDGKSENVPPAGSFKGFGTVAMPSTPPLSPLTELRVKENEQTVDTDLTSNLKDVINKSDSVKSVKKPISSPHFGRHMLGAIAVPLTPRGNSIKKVGLGNGGGTKKFAFPTKTEEHKVDAKTTLPPLTMKTEVADGKDIHSTPRVRMEEDNVEESKVVSPSESKGSHDCCERESGKESNSTLTPFGNLETTKSSTSESNIESDLVDDSVKRIEGAENPDETKTPGAVVVAAERETGANTKADIYTFDDDDDDDDDTCDDLVIVEEKVEPPKSIVQTKHDAESFVAEGVRSGKGRKTREKGCAEDSKTAPVDVSPVVSDKPQKEKNESKGQLSSDTKLTLSRGKEESTSKTQSKPKKSPKQEQKNKGDGPGKRKRKMGTPEPEVICDDNEPTYKSKPRAAKAKTLAACSTKKSSGRRTTSSKSPVSTATNVTSPPQTEPQQQLRVPPLKIRRTNSTMPTVVVESGEMVTTKTTDSTSLKEIFKTIDPTASPFC